MTDDKRQAAERLEQAAQQPVTDDAAEGRFRFMRAITSVRKRNWRPRQNRLKGSAGENPR
jgi:hypothetical protein